MPEDTSLDQFLSGDDTESGDEADATAASPDESGSDDTDGKSADPPVERATATLQYDPDGVACPDCGEVARRRWRDGETFVCVTCKEW